MAGMSSVKPSKMPLFTKESERMETNPISDTFDIAAFSRFIKPLTNIYQLNPSVLANSLSSLKNNLYPAAFSKSVESEDIDSPKYEEINVTDDEVCANQGSHILKENMYNTLKQLNYNNLPINMNTPGLKSWYKKYQRISFNEIKPKIVEDVWVENDNMLTWTDSKIAAYNPAQKLFMCTDCESVGFLSRVAEHWLGAHANLRVFNCPRCPYTSAWSRCVKMHLTRQHNEQFADTTMWKENTFLLEVTKLMQELRTNVENKIDSTNSLSDKRFYCPHCPYATDRRDLYTRHENIHKDDKPFHCYICSKQFNRADHVKKHFIRIHPDSPYDISKIRKHSSPSSASKSPKPDEHSAAKGISENKVKIPDLENEITTKPSETNVIINKEVKTTAPKENNGIRVRKTLDLPSTPESLSYSTLLEIRNRNKKKGQRDYTCPYCQWSGTDNWCLKRHMNTHIKPFACIMCDYKAARAERLSTHVWKVHNKRICNKCNYLADTQERLFEHTKEEHHNNPYSRRHICISCGMSFDTRANLETHLHLTHTRPNSPQDIVEIKPINLPAISSLNKDSFIGLDSDEVFGPLVCPIESCNMVFNSSNMLGDHVRREHEGLFSSRCPHCSYNLTRNELDKDHWLTHHEDVCEACVHVFTFVYGPQLWKKVHNRTQSNNGSLNFIVNSLNKKTLIPESSNETPLEINQIPERTYFDHQDPLNLISKCEPKEFSKRKRKQSFPKKVITLEEELEMERKLTDRFMEKKSSVKTRVRPSPIKRFKKRCLKCHDRPKFESFSQLILHKTLKHKASFKKQSRLNNKYNRLLKLKYSRKVN